jgi:hypothetical protein
MLGAMIDAGATPCSEASAEAGEPLAGSASEAPLFAALAWPKARWDPDKAALSEGLPAAVRELEPLAVRAGRKLQLRLFERAGARGDSGVEVVCADFAAARTLARRAPDAERAAEAIAAFVAGERSGPPLAAPLVLVCTDGRHDRCCGKLGRSLVSALRGAFDVAESSHLGGHRLAANCLVLPSGRLYGRVTPADVPALVEAIRHDSVYLPCYRGQSGLGELEQVAEAAALASHPGARALHFSSAQTPAGDARVSVTGIDAPLEVTCALRTYSVIASCGDAEPERRERWVAVSVAPAGAPL